MKKQAVADFIVLLLVIVSYVALSACNQSPISPSTGLIQESTIETASPQAGVSDGDVQSIETAPKSNGEIRWTWDQSQYRARLTLTNLTNQTLRYVFAAFQTYYPFEHRDFFRTQKLYLPSVADIVLAPSITKTFSFVVPSGCYQGKPITWQADFYKNITKAQVLANPKLIHPNTIPKIYEVDFHFGKTNILCSPPPPPLPPVVITYTVCHVQDLIPPQVTLSGLTAAEAAVHVPGHKWDYAGACR